MKRIMMIFLAATAMFAQSSTAKGTLHGIVTDPSGAAIPAASVIVSGANLVRTISTDETGEYTIAGLQPGHYSMQVHAAGFAPLEKSGFVLSAGYETEADAQLVIKASKQAITVYAQVD
jgi:hypothetical protein